MNGLKMALGTVLLFVLTGCATSADVSVSALVREPAKVSVDLGDIVTP